jgi:sulfur-oxidizing protein SoxY
MSKGSILQVRWMGKAIRLTIAAFLITFSTASVAVADESEESWKDLQKSLYGGRTIEDGNANLRLEAPTRAEEPALVPVEIENLQAADTNNPIKTLTLIVDENPAPVAAVFALAPDAHISTLETRLRVNAYSFVRVIAELQDGTLLMVKRYVKATGGCAAPASKNPDEALASLGQMRLRQYAETLEPKKSAEFQLQIRHPNYSGLQMDQLTGLFRPAHFVHAIAITADGKPVMSVEGAISLSENPSLRFKFSPAGAKTLAAHIEDTEGNVFDKSWPIGGKATGKDS